jgi:hypothetical protein
MHLLALFLVGLTSALAAGIVEAQEFQEFHLEIHWTAPIKTAESGGLDRTPDGLVLLAQSISSQGQSAFLASEISADHRSQVLFVNASPNGLGDRIALPLKGAAPDGEGLVSRLFSKSDRNPALHAVTFGQSGEIWVGGVTNAYLDWSSSYHSDAYLAKIDPSGKLLWEKAYGNGGQQTVWNIGSLVNGDVALVGRDGWAGHVARIGPDGVQLWERSLGNDLGGALAGLPGDRLAVIGFETEGAAQSRDYRANVTLWILDGSGKTLVQTLVRAALSTTPYSYFANLSLVVTPDAIYVTSNWTGLFDARPVEVAKLSLDGELLWSASLTDTVAAVDRSVRTWKYCSPTLAVTPQGDAIVACALNDQIHLYQFGSATGVYQARMLPLPDCQKGHPSQMFLTADVDQAMFLSGSRPVSNVASNCSWTGRLTRGH